MESGKRRRGGFGFSYCIRCDRGLDRRGRTPPPTAAEERRQAVLVGAWTEVDDSAFDPETGEGIVCRLHVANRSDLPVFNVQVTCDSRLGQEDQPWFRWHSLGPGVALSKQV